MIEFPGIAAVALISLSTVAGDHCPLRTLVMMKRPDESLSIFTPAVEMPFAGHPVLGTAWVLGVIGLVVTDEELQRKFDRMVLALNVADTLVIASARNGVSGRAKVLGVLSTLGFAAASAYAMIVDAYERAPLRGERDG